MTARSSRRLGIVLVVLAAAASSLTACRRKEPPTPPVATPSITVSRDRVPIGSPIDLTYKFVVANDAKFDQDYTVMLHVMDADEQLIWTDDHYPPVPTTQWKPGQTVEYTRTIFVPVYPYVGEATLHAGLYSQATQKRLTLSGQDVGQRAYRVGRLQLQPQTESVFLVRKDGWHNAEVADRSGSVEWQWTKKRATIAFKNPKADSILFIDLDNPGVGFEGTQQVRLAIGNEVVDTFDLAPKKVILRKVPIKAAQFGAQEMAELEIGVDKTFIPSVTTGGASKDTRELGVRIFHAYLQTTK